MTCKLDHSIDGTIPAFLCRQCSPSDPDAALFKATGLVATPFLAGALATTSEAQGATAIKYRRRRVRKLRAEVRERSEFLDQLRASGRAAKSDIDKAERGWQSAYTELAGLEVE